MRRIWSMACVALAVGACDRVPDSMRSDSTGTATAATTATAKTAPAAASATTKPGGDHSPAPIGKIDWVDSPPGADVVSLVRAELSRAKTDGRSLVVYVGATWCEPCQRFHAAVGRGDLDASFPRLRVLGFDAERDRDGLKVGGYTSQLIPLFALPGSDGRASGKFVQGSIKGDGAVGEITPKLQALLGA
jgi:hypothetical protein